MDTMTECGFRLLTCVALGWILATATVSGQDLTPDDLFRDAAATQDAEASDVNLSAAASVADAMELLDQLPSELTAGQLAALRQWDRRWAASDSAEARKLGRRVVRRLAASGEARSLEYLHEVFETTPRRRQSVAVALAGYADRVRRRAEDWRLLVRSLPLLDGRGAARVLAALQAFPQRGTKPQWQRQALLAGLRGGDDAAAEASRLLNHWTGQSHEKLVEWQQWFHVTCPDQPRAELPIDPPDSKYTYAELFEFLRSDEGSQGDPRAGAVVYEKALCIRCHRFGDRGEAMGGDLTSARRKFQDKELLQSLLFPSYVIPEEYAAKTVLDQQNRRYTGVTTNSGDKIVILMTDGQKVGVPRDQVQEILPARQSAMPTGLLDQLTREEIADLFAYLLGPPSDQAEN